MVLISDGSLEYGEHARTELGKPEFRAFVFTDNRFKFDPCEVNIFFFTYSVWYQNRVKRVRGGHF